MIIAALLLTFVTTLPASEPTIAVAFQPTLGLSEEEMAGGRARIITELQALGVIVDASAAPVDPACVTDMACVEAARQSLAAPATGLIIIELLRVGPVVQLAASASSSSFNASGSQGLDPDQLAHGVLLPPEIRAWVAALVKASAPPPLAPPSPPSPAGPAPLLSLSTIGIIVSATGGAAAVVGVGLVTVNAPVLDDPDSLGADKERAAAVGYTGIAIAAVGLALVATGVALLVTAE